MQLRLALLAAGFILALGCGKNNPEPVPATPEDEKAAEQRIKEEAANENKQRQAELKNKKRNPDDDD
jgi:hypothetical protein